MVTDDCPDCPSGDGTCQWAGCPNPADYAIRDLEIIHKGKKIMVGDVDICAGHILHYQKQGRLNLDWDSILPAFT